VDGPPVPGRRLYVPGDSPDKLFRLRWPGWGRKNDPELVVDRPVFAAAVYALGIGQEAEGTAILESLGYKVTPLERIADR
jgi:hypothetical protein